MAFKLPRLVQNQEIVTADRKPAGTFIQYWQQLVQQIERAILTIVDLTGIQEQFEQALQQAQQATQAAQEAAMAAQQQTDAVKRETALQNSYIDPSSVLTATPTTITVAAHTRYYGDGTSAMVNGGTAAATAQSVTDYVSYVDPDRMGGTVTYIATEIAPTQTGDTHVVGAIDIPATGTAQGGEGPQRPGYVRPRNTQVNIE